MNEWMKVSTVPSKPVLQGQVEADPSPHFYHEPGNQNRFLNQGELFKVTLLRAKSRETHHLSTLLG